MPRRNTKIMAPYKSGFEQNIAEYLTKNKVLFTYESYIYEFYAPIRKGICLECGSTGPAQIRTYTPDFFLSSGYVLEAKGKFTSKDRTKMALIKEQYPDEKFILVFQRDNYCNRNKRSRYSDWANLNGFEFHIGWDIPSRYW